MSDSAIYAYWGVKNPNYAIQIYSGNYIVSDFGNNRIVELDSTLSTEIRTYSISGIVFFDYSEDNETLLITNATSNYIREITWSDIDLGTTIWQSTVSLNSPQSATYKQNNVNEMVIADMNNNRVVLYDRDINSYSFINYYKISSDDVSIHEISNLYKPYRVYQYSNGNICIIEQKGRQLDFTTVESSSSSSSSSFSSSSSSIDSSSSSSSVSSLSSSSSSSSSIDSSSSSSSSDSSNSSSSSSSLSSGSSSSISSSSSSSNWPDIEVSGAGTVASNGTYTYEGMYAGRQYYIKDVWYIYWDFGSWVIYDVDIAYYSNDNVITPDLCTTWSIGYGDIPVPTVTQG